MPSEDRLRLARAALWGLKCTDSPDFAYQKAAVALLDLSTVGTSQRDLFAEAWGNTCLMMVMDRINGIWGRGTLGSAAEGITKDWKMKRS